MVYIYAVMTDLREKVSQTMAGEITMAPKSSEALKKWRQIFDIKQREVANRLSVSPSVISDYESGRRASPGTLFVKKYIESLIELDEEDGGKTLRKFMLETNKDAILDMLELTQPLKTQEFLKIIAGHVIVNENLLKKRQIRGYTVIDSIKAILNLSERDFRSFYGSSSERALVFTNVKMGRSPMIAVKVTQPKPCMVVLHGPTPSKVDHLAKSIAEKDGIPLVVSKLKTEEDIIRRLRRHLT